MEKRGQISVEYMMIIVIAMMIIIPSVFLFRDYIFESNDKIMQARLSEVAGQIMTKAQKMHYYGPPSKSTVQVDMPPQVVNMYIMNVSSDYYLMFTVLTNNGQIEMDFMSEIPLIPGEEPASCTVPGCQGTCRCFTERYFTSGLKNIQTESSSSCPAGVPFCVIIKENSTSYT
jgi:uncharacterized protein (UPF0333 family)